MTVPSLKSSNSALAPIPAAKRVHDALIAMANGLEGRGAAGEVISHSHAPSDEQRRWMAGRVVELDAGLAPAGERDLRAELASLFAVLATEGTDEGTADAIIAIYLNDLGDIPLFALRAACQHFRKTSKWVPKIVDLRAYALAQMQPWRTERAKIVRLLDARVLPAPPDETARARNLAYAEETKRMLSEAGAEIDRKFMRTQFRADMPAPEPPEDARLSKSEKAEKRLSELAELAAKPLRVSSSLLKSLGMEQREENRREDAA